MVVELLFGNHVSDEIETDLSSSQTLAYDTPLLASVSLFVKRAVHF